MFLPRNHDPAEREIEGLEAPGLEDLAPEIGVYRDRLAVHGQRAGIGEAIETSDKADLTQRRSRAIQPVGWNGRCTPKALATGRVPATPEGGDSMRQKIRGHANIRVADDQDFMFGQFFQFGQF